MSSSGGLGYTPIGLVPPGRTGRLDCMSTPPAASHRMQCMEVWGGNHVVDSGVVMAGLDAWVYSRPFEGAEGGGDVHLVSSCATGRITRLLLADVSGHGMLVSRPALELRGLVRRYVNYLDQKQFVCELNAKLADWGSDGRFATAITTTFFSPTNYLSVCNAGHPAPLLYRARTGRWSLLDANNPELHADDTEGNAPLGLLDEAACHQFGVKLRVGDLVLCYTDSLTESQGTDGRQLGQAGLLAVANGVEVGDAATYVARLVAAIAALHPSNLTEDDVTVLLFRPNGMYPRIPLREKLLTGGRMLRALLGSLRPRGEAMPWPEMSVVNIGGSFVDRLNRRWGGPAPLDRE